MELSEFVQQASDPILGGEVKRGSRRNITMARIRGSFDLKSYDNTSPREILRQKSGNDFIIQNENQQSVIQLRTATLSTEQTFQDKYLVQSDLGQGTTSIVKKVMRKSDGKIFVAKIIKIRDLEIYKQIQTEYEISQGMDHENIVKVEELIASELDYKAYIIMEYCKGKTLKSLIKEKGKFKETELRLIMMQILQAVQYMHQQGVCHRDLKPQNILIDDDSLVKIIDFSVSSQFKKKSELEQIKSPHLRKGSCNDDNQSVVRGLMLTNTGTPEYKAPELIAGAPYSECIDVWAVGVITYYCLTGEKPFSSEYLKDLYHSILEAKINFKSDLLKSLSSGAKAFIGGCLTKSPFVRLTAEEALNHHWIFGIHLTERSISSSNKQSLINMEPLDDICLSTANTADTMKSISLTSFDNSPKKLRSPKKIQNAMNLCFAKSSSIHEDSKQEADT